MLEWQLSETSGKLVAHQNVGNPGRKMSCQDAGADLCMADQTAPDVAADGTEAVSRNRSGRVAVGSILLVDIADAPWEDSLGIQSLWAELVGGMRAGNEAAANSGVAAADADVGGEWTLR